MKTASAASLTVRKREIERKTTMNYSRKSGKSIVLAAVMAALIGMVILHLTVRMPEVEPDIVCPMANAHIDWDQTYFPGTWGGAK